MRSRGGRSIMRAGGVALALALPTGPALAQERPTSEAERRASATLLWTQAWELKDAGNLREACEKFYTVVGLFPSSSAHLQAGACHEQAGRLASAWSAFKAAESMSGGEVDDAKRATLREDAKLGIQRVEPDLSWVQLVLDAPATPPTSLSIRRNGVDQPVGVLGQSLPADAGAIEIVLRAEGYEPIVRRTQLAKGQRIEEHFTLVPAPRASPPTAPPSAPTPRTEAPPPAPERSVPAWAWGAGGVGLVLGAVSVGFLVDDLGAISDLEANCGAAPAADGRYHCATSPNDDLARQARSRDFAIGFGVAGGAALVASGIGIGLALSSESASERARLSPWVGTRSAGLVVGDTF